MADWETRLDIAAQALSGAGGALVASRRLDVGAPVIEIRAEADAGAGLVAAIESGFGAVDHIVSPGPITIPRIFVSDMDSTMIGQECIDELADYAGLKDRIAAITERAMRGELDFEAALRERVALLEGLDESAIERCLAERIRPNDGAKVLVETLKAAGCETILVTGGFHHFADRIGAQLGFDRVVGNRLEVANGALSGRLEGPIVDSAVKRTVLMDRVAAANVADSASPVASCAIGDGANDIPMIEAASHGFAYRAKPAARAAAPGRIENGDLTGVLSLFGIAVQDFATN